jgi:hypothetical protein
MNVIKYAYKKLENNNLITLYIITAQIASGGNIRASFTGFPF